MMDLNNLKKGNHIGMGCSTFGGSSTKKASLRALEYVYENNCRYFDVARSYGYGVAESILGEFARNKRQQIIIASKFGILPSNIPFKSLIGGGIRKIGELIPSSRGLIKNVSTKTLQKPAFTAKLAVESIEKSLKELKTDYLDILLLHEACFDDILKDDLRHVLDLQITKGNIRTWGATLADRKDLQNTINYSNIICSLPVFQFPFGFDKDFEDIVTKAGYTKIIYSVLNYLKAIDKNKALQYFEMTQKKYPELHFIENLSEFILFTMFKKLNGGVILISMLNAEHILRNMFIYKQSLLIEVEYEYFDFMNQAA